MSMPPVTVVTVAYDSFFYTRLLVEKTRAFVGQRDYQIIVVDRGSRDGTVEWLRAQPDVDIVIKRQWRRKHSHGEAAESGIEKAVFDRIVLLDSDAHPISEDWLRLTADRLDEKCRLAGAQFHTPRRDNPHGWYIHPHFMAFMKSDLGTRVVLRKLPGRDTDTGEESTIRILSEGLDVLPHPLQFAKAFSVGNPSFPTISAGVFHAWYSTRLKKNEGEVASETASGITRDNYAEPLRALLRRMYDLDY